MRLLRLWDMGTPLVWDKGIWDQRLIYRISGISYLSFWGKGTLLYVGQGATRPNIDVWNSLLFGMMDLVHKSWCMWILIYGTRVLCYMWDKGPSPPGSISLDVMVWGEIIKFEVEKSENIATICPTTLRKEANLHSKMELILMIHTPKYISGGILLNYLAPICSH